MKDLIAVILRELAGYIPILVSVVATPKRTILHRITREADALNKALAFCGITIAIGFALQAPLLRAGQDFVTVAGSLLAVKVFAILTFAGLILFVFRRLGGTGDYETTLCACLYIISPVYLFLIVTHVINVGVLAAYDPAVALSWRAGQPVSAEQVRALVSAAPVTAGGLLLLWLVRWLVGTIWFLICWGTYRAIHRVSRARSTIAYVITTVMWYVYWGLTVLMMKGLHGGALSPIG